MPIFAVSYLYAEKAEVLDELRPQHRGWLKELLEQGILLASGPMVNQPQALLIFKSESAEQLAQLMDLDPFEQAGFIATRTITEWNPVLGPFSAD
jgi:uncharacterized protein